MPNYVRILATVQRLLEKDGKGLILHKRAAAAADPTKPWRGPGNAADVTLNVFGLLSAERLAAPTSESTRRGLSRALIAPTDAADDLMGFTDLYDGALTWFIVEIKPISPSGLVVLWEMQLKR